MDQIDAALSGEQLAILRDAYSKGRARMLQILSDTIPGRYDRTGGYLGAGKSAFYDDGADTMAPKERERSLIAILASRDAGLNLAIHIYLGLMEGLSPREIADIILLAGVYTGVDRLSDGIVAELRTLGILKL